MKGKENRNNSLSDITSNNTSNYDSIESVNTTSNKAYNPFTDEGEDELAPDAIEEVMKFRAKLAGISLESTDEDQSPLKSVDLLHDRLSSYALREVLAFLIRCIDIIDTPASKKKYLDLLVQFLLATAIPFPLK